MADENDFTQVSIKKAGGYNLISKEEFLSLPLRERVSYILESKVQFLNANGDVIPLRVALQSLKSSG